MYNPGGGATLYVGGTAMPGVSGNQSWNIGLGQWVIPAIEIRGLDWNYAHIWDAQPPSVRYGNLWCHFT